MLIIHEGIHRGRISSVWNSTRVQPLLVGCGISCQCPTLSSARISKAFKASKKISYQHLTTWNSPTAMLRFCVSGDRRWECNIQSSTYNRWQQNQQLTFRCPTNILWFNVKQRYNDHCAAAYIWKNGGLAELDCWNLGHSAQIPAVIFNKVETDIHWRLDIMDDQSISRCTKHLLLYHLRNLDRIWKQDTYEYHLNHR